MGRLPPDFEPQTIFIGGGTPTHLDGPELSRLLKIARDAAHGGHKLMEWTVEANPGTLTPDKLARLKAAGVTRLSIGAQSFNAARLCALSRIHRPAEVAAAVRDARTAGFGRINLDLIYGQPGQTVAEVLQDAKAALALSPEHLSVYALSLEPGTPMHRDAEQRRIRLPEGEAVREQFDALRNMLGAAGFGHYEISNFARPGERCVHNLIYWTGGDYLALGPAAHSNWRGTRRGAIQGLDEWEAASSRGWTEHALEETLPAEKRARETLICWLRLLEGVPREAFRRRTGFDYESLCGPEMDARVRSGDLLRESDRIRLSADALFISDTIFAELV